MEHGSYTESKTHIMMSTTASITCCKRGDMGMASSYYFDLRRPATIIIG